MSIPENLDASFLSPVGESADPPARRHDEFSVFDLERIAKAFEALKRALKNLNFNRHRSDEYREFIKPAHELFSQLLSEFGQIDVKLEVSTLVIGKSTVLEDDQRENNIVFPLWNEGVRLLTFREGLDLDEMLKFFGILIGLDRPHNVTEDILSILWKAELQHVEWVALSDFSIAEGEGESDVEVEVDEVLRYLQSSLSGGDVEGFFAAKVALSDLDLRLFDVDKERRVTTDGTYATADQSIDLQQELHADEGALLEKICSVIFEVMELDAADEELEDIAAALEQLLDGLILQGRFGAINRVIQYADHLASKPSATVANRDLGRRIEERMRELIQQPERVRGMATALNAGRVQSLEELTSYLQLLGIAATVILLELIDTLHSPRHRRVVADVLAQAGVAAVPMFAARLQKASSNLAKDLFYIIDRIDPPTKLDILKPILNHENAVLRVEVLTTLCNTPNARAFEVLKNVFEGHQVPQMRSHAARMMARFPADLAAPYLMRFIRTATFDGQPEGIRAAVVGAVAQFDHEDAQRWMNSVMGEKSGLLKKRSIDETKLLVIRGLSSVPGMPALKALSAIAQDSKTHSKEVTGAAREAAMRVQRILTGNKK